jgi:hypothetical protein
MQYLTSSPVTRPVSDATRPLRTRRAAAAAAVALILATAACGGKSDGKKVAGVDGGKNSAASTQQADDTARAREFAKCMRDNGVPMQDPDPGTGKLDLGALRGGADAQTVRKAMQACHDKAPRSVNGNAKLTEKQLAAMRDLARCMRDAGIPFDDPGPDGFDKSSFPTGAPGFASAMQKCQAAGGSK